MNILYKKSTPVALALGSNVGDGAKTFDQACMLLQDHGVTITGRAGIITTEPVDCPAGTPDFSNSALTGTFDGTPEDLLAITQKIEQQLGRPADHAYHDSRTLDIDIILFGNTICQTPRLTLPHPRAQERTFVLIPLAQIAPDWLFPDTGQTVSCAYKKLCPVPTED